MASTTTRVLHLAQILQRATPHRFAAAQLRDLQFVPSHAELAAETIRLLRHPKATDTWVARALPIIVQLRVAGRPAIALEVLEQVVSAVAEMYPCCDSAATRCRSCADAGNTRHSYSAASCYHRSDVREALLDQARSSYYLHIGALAKLRDESIDDALVFESLECVNANAFDDGLTALARYFRVIRRPRISRKRIENAKSQLLDSAVSARGARRPVGSRAAGDSINDLVVRQLVERAERLANLTDPLAEDDRRLRLENMLVEVMSRR